MSKLRILRLYCIIHFVPCNYKDFCKREAGEPESERFADAPLLAVKVEGGARSPEMQAAS